MLTRFIRWTAVCLVCANLGSVAAAAHDLPLHRVTNAFVKIGPYQADVVVRVPLDLLLGVPFPLTGDHYDIARSGPAV